MIVPFLSLVTLAILAAASDNVELPKYETVLQKGLVGLDLGKFLGPFYIPDGQCSGVLDSVLVCPSHYIALAVRVHVQDGTSFPRVTLDDGLQAASVLRAGDCAGEATVILQLACVPLIGGTPLQQ